MEYSNISSIDQKFINEAVQSMLKVHVQELGKCRFFVTTQTISCKFIAFLNTITFSDSDSGSPYLNSPLY